MRVLVASSSPYRQSLYREAVEKLGHQTRTAGTGIECIQKLRDTPPNVLVLEAPLFWGGSDGVLEVAEQELGANAPAVIVLAVGSGSIDWFQLSRFRIDHILFRVPTIQELEQALASVAKHQSRDGPGGPSRISQARHRADVGIQPAAWNSIAAAPMSMARH